MDFRKLYKTNRNKSLAEFNLSNGVNDYSCKNLTVSYVSHILQIRKDSQIYSCDKSNMRQVILDQSTKAHKSLCAWRSAEHKNFCALVFLF